MKKLIDSLKYLKIRDILSIFVFIFVLIPSQIFRIYLKARKKRLWLICERKNTASDNGYHFFKYMKENHKEIDAYYVIDKKCKEYKKVEPYGNIIQWHGLKHWLYYLAADKNISTQKNGNPEQPLFYLIHVNLNLFNNRVFLQHGVIKDDLKWLYYDKTKFKKFICGAKAEFEYVNEKYGYPSNYVVYTGLARFDNLYNCKVNPKQIVIMPSWRDWLGRETNLLKKDENFVDTQYYSNWNNLLKNQDLIDYIEKNDITIYFYPHINMQQFIHLFTINSANIKVVNNDSADIQELLKESALMVTDFSSVYMDFAYMKKPIIYFQFDKEEYRQKQYAEGYFSYEKDGFGDVLEKEQEVINKIKYYIENNYTIEDQYMKRMTNFFELHDQKNCERIYNAIK